jgi:hypothetical protein
MSSPLPYTERLVYMIQTKMQSEISDDLRHDIETTLWNYAKEFAKNETKEKEHWKTKFFREGK